MTMCLHAWLLLSVSVVTDKGMKLGKEQGARECPERVDIEQRLGIVWGSEEG